MVNLELIEESIQGDTEALQFINAALESKTAQQRIEWGVQHLPTTQVLSSSFGIQSAVMLHLVTSVVPDIPVILIDTGYLFEETYQFVDELTNRLNLNLQVYRADMSPAWQEARYGKLWEQGVEGLNQYNYVNKVEPMRAAFQSLGVGSWFAGLRRQQSTSRKELSVLRLQDGRMKMHPIIDWSNREIHQYLTKHKLPYHPLWDQGYVSVGDKHSSEPLKLGMREEDTRFFGLKRECGLHE